MLSRLKRKVKGMLIKILFHRDTSRDYKSREITVSVPFITERRLGVPTVPCVSMEKASLGFLPIMINMIHWTCTNAVSRLNQVFMIENQYIICHSEKKLTIQILYYSEQHIAGKCFLTLWIMEETWEVTLQNWDRWGHQQNGIIHCWYQTQGLFPMSLQCEHAHWELGYCTVRPLSHCLLKCRKTSSITEYFFLALHAFNWKSGFQTALESLLGVYAVGPS